MKTFAISILLILCTRGLLAQPFNDNWKNASEIEITDSTYGKGLFHGKMSTFSKATIESREEFVRPLKLVALNQKSVWYKFKTTRSVDVSIAIRQKDTLIHPQNLGLTIYQSTIGYPSAQNRSPYFSPLTRVGETSTNCLPPGEYYIQLCARDVVNDSVWISINIENNNIQGNTLFNTLNAYEYFGSSPFGSNCFNLTAQQEIESFKEGVFNKSVYFSFKSSTGQVELNYQFSGKSFYYALYKGNPRDSSSWTLIDSFSNLSTVKDETIGFESGCNGIIERNTLYFIKVLYNRNSSLNFTGVRVIPINTNRSSYPDSFIQDFGVIGKARNINFKDYIDCFANGTQYLCSSQKHILSDTIFTNSNGKAVIDTMNFGSWFKLELKKPTKLKLQASTNAYGISQRQKSWLFKGNYNDSKFCQLSPKQLVHNEEICLDTGIYTFFTGFFRNNFTENDSQRLLFLGQDVNVRLAFELIEKSKSDSSKFSNTNNPKHYRNVLAGSLRTDTVHLEEDWINGPFRKLNVDGEELKGFFTFYTFELEKEAFIYIYPTSSFGFGYNWNLYSGNVANGYNSLKREYSFNTSPDLPTQRISKLPKGIYTIIANRAAGDLCNPPQNHQTDLVLKATEIETKAEQPCKPNFQFTKTAAKLNDGNPLVCTEPKANNTYTNYLLPSTCLDKVNNRGNYHWYNYNSNQSPNERLVYFEFELDQKSNIKIQSGLNFQLIKGFISEDSSIVKSQNNVVVEDSKGQRVDFCSFESGKYTLILKGYGTGYWGQIQVGHFYKNQQDHAKNAFDFGLLSAQRTTAVSNTEFNCSTSYSPTDFVNAKNSWFTFRAAGIGKINIQNNASNIFAYPADTGHNLTFNQVKSLGLVDSVSFATKPTIIGGSRIINIEKAKNDTIRYYFQITHNTQAGIASNTINFNPDLNATENGDFCSNAITGSIDSLGTYNAQVWNSIHTIGEAPNEQFAAQLNSENIGIRKLKSSWFKLNITNNNGNRLVVPNFDPNVFEVKVYVGNCSAMTLIGSISAGNTVSFDCMTNGDYMFQVYSLKEYNGNVGIKAHLRPPLGICAVNALPQLIANFDFGNGCKGDTIQLINLSSAGTDVAYKWYFGNGDSSAKQHPLVTYAYNGPDSVLVILNVVNTVNNNSASYSNWLFLKEPELNVIDDTLVCTFDVNLEIKNYDHSQYKYAWYIPRIYNLIDGKKVLRSLSWRSEFNYQFTNQDKHTVIVSAAIKNCINYDTISIESVPLRLMQMEQRRILFKCLDEPLSIEVKQIPIKHAFKWDNGDTSNIRLVDSVGTFYYSILTKSCEYKDSIIVNDLELPNYTLDTSICKNELVFDFLKINSYGQYPQLNINSKPYNQYLLNDSVIIITFTSNSGKCFLIDSFKAPLASLWNFKNRELSFCEGDSLVLSAPKSPFNYTWNTNQNDDSITVDSAANYKLIASLNGCQYTLNYLVSETRSPKAINDTTVCSFDTPLFYEVKDSFDLLWSTGENASSISVSDSGLYWYVAKTKNCEFSDSFMVMRDCPPQLYIPNAFTPGTDNLNPTFIAKGTEIENYVMRIYAQNGQIVFYSNDLSSGWDGTIRGEIAPVGTYFYVISYKLNNESKTESGNLVLIR